MHSEGDKWVIGIEFESKLKICGGQRYSCRIMFARRCLGGKVKVKGKHQWLRCVKMVRNAVFNEQVQYVQLLWKVVDIIWLDTFYSHAIVDGDLGNAGGWEPCYF